jgi:hypothetical protein
VTDYRFPEATGKNKPSAKIAAAEHVLHGRCRMLIATQRKLTQAEYGERKTGLCSRSDVPYGDK